MARIQEITSKLILNSQGKKAIDCTVTLDNGSIGIFAPPAGTSVGKYEAKTANAEVAQEQIRQITTSLKEINNIDQYMLDKFIGKRKELSANATIAISVAFAIAADTLALLKRQTSQDALNKSQMPKLMVLFFEGGVHSSSNVGIQEFMLIYDDVFKAAEDFNKIKKQLIQQGHFVNTGMEGAMVSEKIGDKDALALLDGKDIALDIGGHYLNQRYDLDLDIMKLPEKYSIVSIEDPYPEDDVENWKKLYQKWSNEKLIVADDLTVTDKERIKKYANKAMNSVIIKPNQQRTLTDTLEAVDVAKKEGLKIIVSHRSGETNQTFVSDLAVAIGADYVKFGAPVRGERVAKYNRLLELTNN